MFIMFDLLRIFESTDFAKSLSGKGSNLSISITFRVEMISVNFITFAFCKLLLCYEL